jgi:superoxide reductase
MKLFECSVCGHIEFNAAPEVCLVCRATRDKFKENPAAIKRPADAAHLTDGEKKHIPQIVVVKECGLVPNRCCTDVHVRVGEILHVMEPAHFIRCIDYYVNHTFISRVWLSPGACNPGAALHLNAPSGAITAVEYCNVHGNWMSEVTV